MLKITKYKIKIILTPIVFVCFRDTEALKQTAR